MGLTLMLTLEPIIGSGVPRILFDACQVSGKLGVLVQVTCNGVHYLCNSTGASGTAYREWDDQGRKLKSPQTVATLWKVQGSTCKQVKTSPEPLEKDL